MIVLVTELLCLPDYVYVYNYVNTLVSVADQVEVRSADITHSPVRPLVRFAARRNLKDFANR